MTERVLALRTRSDSGKPEVAIRHYRDVPRIAVVICDMWDATQCVSAARRATELAPRINEVAAALRRDGTLIVHAPAGCMEYYANTRARARAQRAPKVESPVSVDWQEWNPLREAALPESLTDQTPCSCEPGEPPCTSGASPLPWTHQIDTIEISSEDAVTDDGNELLALLEERGIEDVIVMGVHSNRCVLGRPYGIRQLVYWGKRPVLCRDLTDSYHRDPRGHRWGNEQVIAHIERHWCPTVTSDQLIVGASPRSDR